MSDVIEEIRREEQEAIKEKIEKARRDERINSKAESIINLMRSFNFTFEKAVSAIKVPEADLNLVRELVSKTV